MEYLAELFTAGDADRVTAVLKKLAAMRSFMRGISLGNDPDDSIPEAVGMDSQTMYEMYRLMAIAKYDERYVIPKAHVEQAHDLEEMGCSLDFDGGPGHAGLLPVRRGQRQARPGGGGDLPRPARPADHGRDGARPSHLRGRVNLLNWDGKRGAAGAVPGQARPEPGPGGPAEEQP